MEQEVIFRDFQEAQSNDFNNLQAYVRQSFDDLVFDAVTATLRYSGFNVAITGTAEVTAAPGRFYGPNTEGQNGAVYTLTTSSVISLVSYLAVASQRYVTLVAYGADDQTNTQTRDFLTNVTTGQTEPQAVPMTDSRDAVLAIVPGTEGPDPVPPAVPTTQVPICNVLLSTTGVVSVSMLTAGLITSTEELNDRLTAVENFDDQIEPQVAALASALAALANEIAGDIATESLLVGMMQDIAQLKVLAGLPSSYSDYGANFYMFPSALDDVANTQALGWLALVQQGVRFPAQNASTGVLAMFNPLDPNASYNSGTGLLLPAYTTVPLFVTGAFVTSVPIGQYGYQTFSYTELNIPYTSIRFGGTYYECSNWASHGVPLGSPGFTGGPAPVTPPSNAQNWTQTAVLSGQTTNSHEAEYATFLMVDQWTEPYEALDATTNEVNGALIAQSFLMPNDAWITQVGIYLASVASPSANITVQLCVCTNGQPDLTQVIATGTLQSNALVTGMNYLQIPPTFAAQGMRLAVIIMSAANHGLGLAAAGSYLNGTFFYSLDGAYYLGDLSKEMVLEIDVAQFDASQAVIQFNSLNLEGGIRDLQLQARMQVPASCQLIFEYQEAGSADWIAIAEDTTNPTVPFTDAPVLINFRGRFVGTPDIMPGIVLTDSIMTVWCPGPSFTYVSEPNTLADASENISVKMLLQYYNPTPHTFGIKIYSKVAASGNITFVTNPANGTTVTINGTVVTFVTSGATGNQVNIGGALGNTLTSLAAFLNASADTNIDQATYTATATQLLVTDKTGGTGGNAFTLATNVSGATVSGATLAGGTAFGAINPTVTTFEETNASDGSYTVQATFTDIPSTEEFTYVLTGTTNSVSDTFLVSEGLWWSV